MICHSFPCLRGCPNEAEPRPALVCDLCKEKIVEGDEYMDFEGINVCQDCLENHSARSILEEFGGSFREAERDTQY